ncbi:MAG: indolepyruvate ferredoxin oxidoreductase family protein, partial [Gammaproteobacteria bacterium PRO9]|nr:indolepyruvate ferredoxin oxidoreductase family protein [Gammaproteobacteria bacterium PRO9]
PEDLQAIIADRATFLTAYQDNRWATQYTDFLAQTMSAVHARLPGSESGTEFGRCVARYLFKLMACKDEYEVARLQTDPQFSERIAAQFEGDYRLVHYLAPPLFARRNSRGELIKRPFGPWIRPVFRVLARLKFLRGTPLDPFGHTKERRIERALIQEYRDCILELLPDLRPDNLALAIRIASLPEHIRGYGHIKQRHLAVAREQWASLMQQWRADGMSRQH